MTTIIYNGPYDTAHYQLLSSIGTNGDILSGYLLDGQRYRMTVAGEQGHGLFLGGAVNGQYSDIEAVDCFGDGIYIGHTDPYGNEIGLSQSDTLTNVRVRNARRNGISIVGAKWLTIDGFRIYGTQGVAPMAGIDFEPDYSTSPNDGVTLKNGWISGCQNYGITANTDYTTNVTIENTVVIADKAAWALFFRLMPAENYVRNSYFVGPCGNLQHTYYQNCTFVTLGGGNGRDFCLHTVTLLC